MGGRLKSFGVKGVGPLGIYFGSGVFEMLLTVLLLTFCFWGKKLGQALGAFEQRTAVAASHWDVMVPCCTAAICSKCLGFEGTGGVQVEGFGDGSLVSAENPPNVGTCSPSRLCVAQEYVPVSKRFHWALVALLANRCRSGFSGGVGPAPRERRRSSCEVQGEY